MISNIALFPLNIVIFPESSYPLHIFEERYKKLINKCLTEDIGFGIVTKFKQELSKIGCYVNVIKLLKKYHDGKMDIIVNGTERFYILSTEMDPDGYLIAEVSSYHDLTNDYNPALLDQVMNLFNNVIRKASVKLEDVYFQRLNDVQIKSFKIAEKCGLSLEQQQQFLSIQNEDKRLYFLKEHLGKLNNYINENKIVKEIVIGDGYINQKSL